MSDDPLGKLIASVQAALHDATRVTDYRAKRALTRAAQVQADCAVAVALNRLATALDRLAEGITIEENP